MFSMLSDDTLSSCVGERKYSAKLVAFESFFFIYYYKALVQKQSGAWMVV